MASVPRFLAACLLAALPPLAAREPAPPLPHRWPKQDLQRYLALESAWAQPQPAVTASRGMIAATTGPLAIHAGLEALRHGGTAADAVLTTALAQIALSAGGAISYAGMMTVVYYDAASARVYALDAGFHTVRDERSPLTIPGHGQPSGRTALVPGFMAGVEALHRRFGRLPFATLFGPAIWIAERGVPVSPPVGSWLVSQKAVITRLPETRRVFTRDNGEFYRTGELFRQPALAGTLKEVSRHGAGYMYRGEWARRFVAAVRREGGRMTLEDLAAYRAAWPAPLRVSYRDYEVVALPGTGGLMTLGGLKVAEAANLRQYGHYTRSADTLYYLIQIARIQNFLATGSPRILRNYFPGVDPSPAARFAPGTAARLWAFIQKDMDPLPPPAAPRPQHSTGIVAVDAGGNVAAVLHSLNGDIWGSTGLFVDGVSIPDPGSFQQREIAQAGPGARLPEATIPLIVLQAGKPVLASSAMGLGLHTVTLQNVLNVLEFGMDPQTAVDQPNFRGPHPANYRAEAVGKGDFPPEVLEGVRARGQLVQTVGKYDLLGYWIGIHIDPSTRRLAAGVTSHLNALAEGY